MNALFNKKIFYFVIFALVSGFTMSLPSVASAKEWCPQYQGEYPKLVVNVQNFQLFYFTEWLNVDNQNGMLIVTSDQQELSSEYVPDAYADWFADLTVDAASAGFAVDSHDFEFQYAWILFQGRKLVFRDGAAHQAVCE